MNNTLTNKKPISFTQMKMLKHYGKLQSVKVCLGFVKDVPVVHIHDFEFFTFEASLSYLQYMAQSVVYVEIV